MTVLNNLIAGEWVAGKTIAQNINPSDTNDIIGEHAMSSAAQVADAVAAARAGLKLWSGVAAQQRADILFKVSVELLERSKELGEMLAREEGKTIPEAMGEVGRAAQIFRYFAGEAVRFGGEKLSSVRPGIDVDITREPVGVIGIITPWNFPIAVPSWKIAPALAFGNTVVFKPAELTPATSWALMDVLNRAGLPPGVVNMVMGTGPEVGQAIVEHVDAVTFTGSVASGRAIVQTAAGRMIAVQAEMGGKNPLIVLDDADLDTAVNCAVDGSFFQTGQRCTASSRLIVTEGIHDKFVDAVAQKLQTIVTGHALDSKTQVGPVVSEQQLKQDLKYIEIGEQEGAHKALAGGVIECSTPGYYLTPTLFTETNNDMRINREEIFGPVATVIRVADYEQALSVANDTEFGLSSGIVTTSHKYAKHFQANSESGLTMTNLPTAGLDYHVPFGGRKSSSFGPREQGSYAVEFYTEMKTSYVL